MTVSDTSERGEDVLSEAAGKIISEIHRDVTSRRLETSHSLAQIESALGSCVCLFGCH